MLGYVSGIDRASPKTRRKLGAPPTASSPPPAPCLRKLLDPCPHCGSLSRMCKSKQAHGRLVDGAKGAMATQPLHIRAFQVSQRRGIPALASLEPTPPSRRNGGKQDTSHWRPDKGQSTRRSNQSLRSKESSRPPEPVLPHQPMGPLSQGSVNLYLTWFTSGAPLPQTDVSPGAASCRCL